MVPLPNLEKVQGYFLWRQEDAHRNSLNAHCYWLLRKEGMDSRAATDYFQGTSNAFKNELLFSRGINFNDIPSWQKRGIGIYCSDVEKIGFNPITKEKVKTIRRELKFDYDLPLGQDYAQMLTEFLEAK